MWAGPAEAMMAHFEALGFSCPQYVNPADFVVDVTSGNVANKDMLPLAVADLANTLAIAFANNGTFAISHVAISYGDGGREDDDGGNFSDSFSRNRSLRSELLTIWLLLVRNSVLRTRQPELLVTKLINAIGVAVLMSWFYAPIGRD